MNLREVKVKVNALKFQLKKVQIEVKVCIPRDFLYLSSLRMPLMVLGFNKIQTCPFKVME